MRHRRPRMGISAPCSCSLNRPFRVSGTRKAVAAPVRGGAKSALERAKKIFHRKSRRAHRHGPAATRIKKAVSRVYSEQDDNRYRFHLYCPRASAHGWGKRGAHPHRDQQNTTLPCISNKSFGPDTRIIGRQRNLNSLHGSSAAPVLFIGRRRGRLDARIEGGVNNDGSQTVFCGRKAEELLPATHNGPVCGCKPGRCEMKVQVTSPSGKPGSSAASRAPRSDLQ